MLFISIGLFITQFSDGIKLSASQSPFAAIQRLITLIKSVNNRRVLQDIITP